LDRSCNSAAERVRARAGGDGFVQHERRHGVTCYHPPAVRCAIDTVGIDHFIFGTDSPPLFALKREGVERIGKLGLQNDEKEKVYFRNAKQLLKL
jgi:predicted TIM-barrel fold metal-dependent hydrolase